MYFNDSADTQNSLYHYTLFLLGLEATDTTSFPIADFTRSFNSWLRKAVFLIWRNSDSWEFDDSNYATMPVATTTLVDGQADYTMPSNALDIERVEVLNSSGDYQLIPQITKEQIKSGMTEMFSANGMPEYYDIIGNSIILYPTPASGSVTLSSGLKLYLTRDIDGADEADTSYEPGINKIFHPLISYGCAFDYAVARNMDTNKITVIKTGINEYQTAIEDYYAKKNRDFKTQIKPKARLSI